MGQAQTISAEFLKTSCTADGCCERRGFPDRLADTVKVDVACFAGGIKGKENLIPEDQSDRSDGQDSLAPCASFAPCQTLPKEVSLSTDPGLVLGNGCPMQTPEQPGRQASVFSSRCTEPEHEEHLGLTPVTRPGMMPLIMPPETRLAAPSTARQVPGKDGAQHIWEQEPSPEPSARQRDEPPQLPWQVAAGGVVDIEQVIAAMSATGAISSPCASSPAEFHSARGSPAGFVSPTASWGTTMSPDAEHQRSPESCPVSRRTAEPHAVTPPRHADVDSTAACKTPHEGRMQEAQALLASMLTPPPVGDPDLGSKSRRRSKSGRRRSTTPRANAPEDTSDRRSRASSCISAAPSEEPRPPLQQQQALRPLNGSMPQFPSADLRTAEQQQQPARAQPRAAGRWLRPHAVAAG